MNSHDIMKRFRELATPLVADAVIRLGLPAKIAPSGIRPIVVGSKFAGTASPVVLSGYADRVGVAVLYPSTVRDESPAPSAQHCWIQNSRLRYAPGGDRSGQPNRARPAARTALTFMGGTE